jgi:hypothetical protein
MTAEAFGSAATVTPEYEDGPGGPIYVWVCELCGQPVGSRTECNSAIHVGPNGIGAKGKPVKSTELASRLRRVRRALGLTR